MLHEIDGRCPNCRESASTSIGSLHSVKHEETKRVGNLFLPDQPSRDLLDFEEPSWETQYVRLSTRRTGPGSGKIDVLPEACSRLSPLEDHSRAETERHLTRQVIRYFQGNLAPEDAEHLILCFSAGDQLIG